MTQRKILLIAFAAASIYAARVQAQPSAGPPGMGPRHMMGGGPGRLIPMLLRSTDLTPDQETQAHQILDADRPAVQGIFDQLRQANKDMASLLLDPNTPSDALAAQQALITQLQQQLAQHETATVLAIRALLKPEQLAKAVAAKDQWQEWHGDKHSCTKNAN